MPSDNETGSGSSGNGGPRSSSKSSVRHVSGTNLVGRHNTRGSHGQNNRGRGGYQQINLLSF
ncbi:hypothetical protein BV898_19612, partial [Hypsibius exemplaris]